MFIPATEPQQRYFGCSYGEPCTEDLGCSGVMNASLVLPAIHVARFFLTWVTIVQGRLPLPAWTAPLRLPRMCHVHKFLRRSSPQLSTPPQSPAMWSSPVSLNLAVPAARRRRHHQQHTPPPQVIQAIPSPAPKLCHLLHPGCALSCIQAVPSHASKRPTSRKPRLSTHSRPKLAVNLPSCPPQTATPPGALPHRRTLRTELPQRSCEGTLLELDPGK